VDDTTKEAIKIIVESTKFSISIAVAIVGVLGGTIIGIAERSCQKIHLS
jgi:hypothetical protein